jgi:hypothetical protein
VVLSTTPPTLVWNPCGVFLQGVTKGTGNRNQKRNKCRLDNSIVTSDAEGTVYPRCHHHIICCHIVFCSLEQMVHKMQGIIYIGPEVEERDTGDQHCWPVKGGERDEKINSRVSYSY